MSLFEQAWLKMGCIVLLVLVCCWDFFLCWTQDNLRQKVAQANGCNRVPKLVEVIAALPEQYKKVLGPYFKVSGWLCFAFISSTYVCMHVCMYLCVCECVCVWVPGFATLLSWFYLLYVRARVYVGVIQAKPIRTASGIAVVAVMSKPHRCPHIAMTGNVCVYCPGGPDSDFEYSTQSYTGYEPTSMRAIRARYNPYLQTKDRVDQLKRLGHDVDKVGSGSNVMPLFEECALLSCTSLFLLHPFFSFSLMCYT